jgi:protein-S-isoprenylcysteine O-methyltransferase Ste14
MNQLEHRIPPPILMVLTAAVMWGVARLLPAAQFAPVWRFAGAAGFGLIAFVFGSSAIRAFRRARTTINPVQIDQASRLVTAGIYGVTRNPMYVGLAALLTGWAFWLAAPWPLVGPLLLALFIHRFQIIPEERVLLANFGSEYADYRQRVRRWL